MAGKTPSDQNPRIRVSPQSPADDHLRALTLELLLAEERERRRLAKDLHDGPCQLLNVANLRLGMLRDDLSDGKLQEELRSVGGLVEEACRTMSGLSATLNPPDLLDMSLGAAIRWLGDQLDKRYHLKVEVMEEPESSRLDDLTRILLFRCARELLVNAAQHSGAPAATVTIRTTGGIVSLRVKDAGRGFDPSHLISTRQFGLSSVRQRVANMDGSMEIQSARGQGAAVTLIVPFCAPEENHR